MNNFSVISNTSATKLPSSVYISYRASLITWMVVVLTINIFGIFTNLITFLATLRYPPLRRSSSCVLLAHCIAIDFLISLCVGPGLVLVTYYGSQPLPIHFCQIWGTIVWGAVYTSNWSHSILAVNRFIAAVFPYQYKYLTTWKMLTMAVAFPWIASIVLNSFAAAEYHVRFDIQTPWTSCTPGPVSYKPLNGLVAFGVYIPCCITGLGYTFVLVTSKIAVMSRVGDISHHSALNKRYETSKMLFLSFVWNSFSNFVVPIAATFYSVAYFTNPVMQLALKVFQYVSSAVNPVFFIAVSVNYRRGVLAVLQCRIRATGGLWVASGFTERQKNLQLPSHSASTRPKTVITAF